MLMKTSVARRVLSHLWAGGACVESAEILRFDAAGAFGVSADACLFICRMGRRAVYECAVADLDRPDVPLGEIGWRHETLVSDPRALDRRRALLLTGAGDSALRWRSGCQARLRRDHGARARGERHVRHVQEWPPGEQVELEPEYVYPLLKGTDLAHGRVSSVRRWLVVTQDCPGADTSVIARLAPRTWTYLSAHGHQLDLGRSSIYRNRPRFSVFGVGPYTFAPWKVAISALHKRLNFVVVGPIEGSSGRLRRHLLPPGLRLRGTGAARRVPARFRGQPRAARGAGVLGCQAADHERDPAAPRSQARGPEPRHRPDF